MPELLFEIEAIASACRTGPHDRDLPDGRAAGRIWRTRARRPTADQPRRRRDLTARCGPLAESFPLRRVGQPQDVAAATLFFASERSSWITGITIDIAGWAYGAIYRTSTGRTAALDGWLWRYNHQRRHSALGHQPPIARLNERTQP
jgi:hypothetical protein